MIGKDILTVDQFDRSDIEKIIDLASKMEADYRKFGNKDILSDKIMASLFFEPSTRTRFSFEGAMIRLGGKIIATTGLSATSTGKGETLSDTIKTIERYTDVIVMRHPELGSANIAAESSKKPVFNAGDGAGEHPTQAFVDYYTIKKAKGETDGLKIALVGDLKYGRTVRSLIKLLITYGGSELLLVSPTELKLPEEYLRMMDEKGISYFETEQLDDVIEKCDVLYMTRIQKERFDDKEAYERLKGCYVLDNKALEKAKSDMVVMHPLPRIDEINTEIDNDPRAIYFDQVENALYVRMAFLALVFDRGW